MSLSQRELEASLEQVIASGLQGVAFDNHLALCQALGRPVEAYKTLRLRCDAGGDWFDWYNATSAAFNGSLADELLTCARTTSGLADAPPEIAVATAGMYAWILTFVGSVDQDMIDDAQRRYVEKLRGHPTMATIPPFDWSRRAAPGEQIRIGYLWDFFGTSAEFCMPKHHDRPRYHVVGIGTRKPGLSAEDLGFEQFIDHSPNGAAATAEAVRAAELDLLVDLSGRGVTWTTDLLIEARLAPRQATYLNFFGSTSSPSMDALIGDAKFLDAFANRGYPERLITVDEMIMAVRNPFWEPHSERRGIPERPFRHRFGTTGNYWKFSDDLIRLIVAVLERIPDSSFFYASIPTRDHVDYLMARFLKFGAPQSRIELFTSKRIDYVSSVNALDAAIDSIPYNGHLSATEFLSLDCPVWSLSGTRPNQRYGDMILSQINERSYLFDDADALVADMARRIAVRDPAASLGIAANVVSSGLIDPVRGTRAMERAYETLLKSPTSALPWPSRTIRP